jgi:glycosyltransferase involved in cell wall biosynthesis
MTAKRKVMVGTPCYDGRADVWYFNSLFQTAKMAHGLNVEIIPIWLSYDALVQRARNDCIALALETQCDDIIFIDSDLEWQPEWFFQLLDYPVDVVGGTYRKKTDDNEVYVAKFENLGTIAPDPHTGLLEVQGLGTGFLRLSNRAMRWLWDNSEVYNEREEGKHRRWIFEVIVENGNLISEDILLCRKLRENGFPIWLDPRMTLSHIGNKKYQGNFQAWLDKAQQLVASQTRTSKPSIQDLYR